MLKDPMKELAAIARERALVKGSLISEAAKTRLLEQLLSREKALEAALGVPGQAGDGAVTGQSPGGAGKPR